MTNGEKLARKWYAAYRRVMHEKFGDHVAEFEQLTPPTRACVLQAFTEVISCTACETCRDLLQQPCAPDVDGSIGVGP